MVLMVFGGPSFVNVTQTIFLSKTLGVGGIVRYTLASADFPVTGQPSVPVKAGGLQVGGGLRVFFPRRNPRSRQRRPRRRRSRRLQSRSRDSGSRRRKK
jgi:hypothetical protein